MLTASRLEKAFSVYLPELERIRTTQCYWPVLHVVLALPDICAALQAPNGETSPDKYVSWADDFLAGNGFYGADWYRVRCAVLHLGSSLPDPHRKIRSRFDSFSFVSPEQFPASCHKRVTLDGQSSNITLDIALLADEMVGAVRRWFAEVVTDPVRAGHVTKNLPKLVRVQPKQLFVEEHDGSQSSKTVFVTYHGFTTSSTGTG